jgi:hypothetical protein
MPLHPALVYVAALADLQSLAYNIMLPEHRYEIRRKTGKIIYGKSGGRESPSKQKGVKRTSPNPLIFLVGARGFEPPTL